MHVSHEKLWLVDNKPPTPPFDDEDDLRVNIAYVECNSLT